jgi:hypothetical protein
MIIYNPVYGIVVVIVVAAKLFPATKLQEITEELICRLFTTTT